MCAKRSRADVTIRSVEQKPDPDQLQLGLGWAGETLVQDIVEIGAADISCTAAKCLPKFAALLLCPKLTCKVVCLAFRRVG